MLQKLSQTIKTNIADIKMRSLGAPLMTADALVQRHCPRYHFDSREQFFPLDLHEYLVNGTQVPGVNAWVTTPQSGVYRISYWCFYIQDCNPHDGGHPFDLERMVVEVDSTDSITGIAYCPHGDTEHMWIRDPQDISSLVDSTGRPVAYVAYCAHGCYPVADEIHRLFGLGNDTILNPVQIELTPRIFSPEVIKIDSIGGSSKSITRRMKMDGSEIPVVNLVRLSQVTRRLLYTAPWEKVWTKARIPLLVAAIMLVLIIIGLKLKARQRRLVVKMK